MNDRRARLAQTFLRYAEELRMRTTTLQTLMAENPIDLRAVSLQAHTLAGSGTTMGAEDISIHARELEHLAQDITTADSQPDAAQTLRMRELSGRLVELAGAFDPEIMLNSFIARVFPQG